MVFKNYKYFHPFSVNIRLTKAIMLKTVIFELILLVIDYNN